MLQVQPPNGNITEREEADEALRKSEERLRSITANSPDMILLISTKGEILFINYTFTLKPGQIIGKSVLDFIPAEFHDSVISCFEHVRTTGKPGSFYTEYHFPTGEIRIFDSRVGPVFHDGEVDTLVINARDITDCRHAEEALQASEVRYRDLADSIADIFFAMDQDLRYTYWNKASEKLTGIPAQDAIGKTIHEIFSGTPDTLRAVEVYKDVLRTHQPRSFVNEQYLGGKHLFFEIEAYPSAGGIAVFTKDITGRKQMEEALHKAVLDWQFTFDSTQDGICLLDADQRIKMCNRRMQELVGIKTADGIIGRHCWEVVHGTAGPIPGCPHIRMQASLKRETMELEIGKGWFSVVTDPMLDETRTLVGSVHSIRDITGRKRAEQALQESEERYRTIMDQAADAVFIHDRTGRILDVNRRACQNLGYSREELLSKSIVDIDPEAIQTGKNKLWGKVMAGEQVTFESHELRKDGSVFPVEVTLGMVHMSRGPIILGTVRDITGRRKDEEDLKMREQSYRTLAENLPGIVYRIHVGENSRMQFFNTMHVEMTGYSEEELTIGNVCGIDPLIVAEDRERVIVEVESAIRENRTFHVEYRITHKDGSIRFFNERGRPLIDETGHLFIDGIIQDATDRNLMESEIRSLNTVLEQRIMQRTAQLTSSLEEKDVLFREVHHRVKNNLQIIISLLNLQSRSIEDKKTQQLIRESQNRIRAMALVHEKLYESADIAKINLDNYIRFLGNNLIQFYGMKEKGITLTTDIFDISLAIDTAIPVGLMINELISNSLKYAFPDGRKGEISLSIHRQNHKITILFMDNGVGIPQDLDWRDTKSLGLRLVNSLVEQLQGTIELDRTAGTVFSIVVQEKE
jgi:PAS domain S-box-containing protein